MKWSEGAGGIEFKSCPVGSHAARCIRIIDIGTQVGEYQGKPNHRHQCIIMWETPNELMTDGEKAGQPYVVSKFYTASLSDKATLRKHLASWRGRDFTPEELQGFESKNILGKACMLSVTANDKGKPEVSGVMAVPKGMEVPPAVNPLVFFSMDSGEFDRFVFESLSKGIKNLIMKSPEYKALTSNADENENQDNSGSFSDFADDIPF